MNDGGRLRFEAGNMPQDAPLTCGQNVHKSKPGNKLRRDIEKARPSDRLRHDKSCLSGDESPSIENIAPSDPDDEAADGGGAASGDNPGRADKKASREARRFEKSGQRVEKADEKLDEARDKLAAQKPPKRSRRVPSGPIKAVGRMARAELWAYTHGKIYQVEHENVGVEAAHKTELAGEGGARSASGFIRRRIRTRPARRAVNGRRKA